MRSSTDPVATRTRSNIAILILLILVGTGIAAAPTPVLADVSGLAYSSYLDAYDNTGGTSDIDEAYYSSWPSDLDRWSASQLEESEGSTGTGGVGTYRVRSATSHVFDPAFASGRLSSIAISSSVRIDTFVAGCESGDRVCNANGNAGAQYDFSIEVTEGTRLRLSGTVTTSQPGSSTNGTRCAIRIHGGTINRVFECNRDDHISEVVPISFDEILPAGWYEFDVATGAFSNAYDYLTTGYAQVDTDLRLEVDGGEPQTVDFDWTVPDRFGNDDNGDGLIDYTAPDGPVAVEPPDGWQVDFIALDSTPCDDGLTRSWSIDGDPISTADSRALVLDPHGCAFSYRFETEGVYEVTLEVRQADESPLGDVTMTVTVQDWLIVSIGDSVASGEGNPDRASLDPFTPETWQDQQCHRTALAGPAQAALAIEQGDPKTSVTFIHLACSGATIASGLIGRYGGIETFADLPPQLDQILAFAGEREIDAITVSIGANDVHFAKILEKCVIQPLCHTDTPGSAARYFANRVRNLPGWFDALQAGITGREFDPARVFITQYFDPTRSDSGSICPDGTILGDAPVPGFLQISEAEANWASNDMLVRLDSEVRAAQARHHWKFVDGIRDPFLAHGYCAGDRWVVTMTESQLSQGDKNGTIHPNVPGHALYGSAIADSLLADLYTDSDLTKPRAPAPGE